MDPDYIMEFAKKLAEEMPESQRNVVFSNEYFQECEKLLGGNFGKAIKDVEEYLGIASKKIDNLQDLMDRYLELSDKLDESDLRQKKQEDIPSSSVTVNCHIRSYPRGLNHQQTSCGDDEL